MKPDVISLPDAVKALAEFFGEWSIDQEIEEWWIDDDDVWFCHFTTFGTTMPPKWHTILDGNSAAGIPSAKREGLEDLFTTILTDAVDKEAEHDSNPL